MATTTHTLIGKQTVKNGGAASVTFTNIPNTFTDLKIIASTRASGIEDSFYVYLNGVTTGYTWKRQWGSGSSNGSSSGADAGLGLTNRSNYYSSSFASNEIYIYNYATTNNKCINSDTAQEDSNTLAYQEFWSGLWSNSATVSSVTLTIASGVFVENSTFTLYGISNSSSQVASNLPRANGGDIIVNDGTYWYHAFKSSGTFTPYVGLSADILAVAGGGAGGNDSGGGGGAGGVIYFAASSLTANSSYTCSVGAGGSNPKDGTNTSGTDSYFGSLTHGVGGGAGGNSSTRSGFNGGSGGGGSGFPSSPGYLNNGGTSTQTGTGATAYYGNAGGYASGNSVSGAGGGGAGAAGSNSTTTSGNVGGVGISTISSMTGSTLQTWLSTTGIGQNVSGTYYIAGGGGGGNGYLFTGASGGNGGGGQGGGPNGSSNDGKPGTANTGGGGGGGNGNPNFGGNGGSGFIIVRYAI